MRVAARMSSKSPLRFGVLARIPGVEDRTKLTAAVASPQLAFPQRLYAEPIRHTPLFAYLPHSCPRAGGTSAGIGITGAQCPR